MNNRKPTNDTKRKTKVKESPNAALAEQLNDFAARTAETSQTVDYQAAEALPADVAAVTADTPYNDGRQPEGKREVSDSMRAVFDKLENREVYPRDLQTEIPVASMESNVGYSSLLRQMEADFRGMVAFHRSKAGGSLTMEEARAAAFHACADQEEAVQTFDQMMSLPLEILSFIDLMKLQVHAPRVAEGFWEMVKIEGRAEFESGHLAANINFPVNYQKNLWNVARYLGVRESFIDDWRPQGGIEIAMIDMMAQSYFQWQYWLEQTVKRSQTRVTETHPDYERWLEQRNREFKANGWIDGYWNRPLVSEQEALDKAVQMADRFNRIFMRTLRQLRDLRRYSPVTINNPQQVNIAADGGQQVNVSKMN